jgi:hypothetical protein
MRLRRLTTTGAAAVLLLVVFCASTEAQQGSEPGMVRVPGHPPAEACTSKDCPPPKDTVPAKPDSDNATPEQLPRSITEVTREIGAAIKLQAPCTPRQTQCALTPQQKFMLFVHRSYSPLTFAGAGFDTVYTHFTHDTYGRGIEGFGKRFGANIADGEARSLMQTYLLSSLFHHDPRYHRLGKGNAFYRAAYAASRVAVARTDDGRNAFNWPELIGSFAASGVSNLYYPDRDRGWGHTVGRAITGFGSDATTEILREFAPDIKRWFRRHEPKRVQKIQDKVDRE